MVTIAEEMWSSVILRGLGEEMIYFRPFDRTLK